MANKAEKTTDFIDWESNDNHWDVDPNSSLHRLVWGQSDIQFWKFDHHKITYN